MTEDMVRCPDFDKGCGCNDCYARGYRKQTAGARQKGREMAGDKKWVSTHRITIVRIDSDEPPTPLVVEFQANENGYAHKLSRQLTPEELNTIIVTERDHSSVDAGLGMLRSLIDDFVMDE